MAEGSRLLDAATEAIGGASNLAEALRLVDHWGPRFHDSLGGPVVAGPRPDLRMDVAKVPGRGGFTARRGDGFLVAIGDRGNFERRFTLAHELAHVVINGAASAGFELRHDDEEKLCDRFAGRVLAPPTLVRAYLGRRGLPAELADVRRFGSHFQISLRNSLVALDEFIPSRWPIAFVAASWRGHPLRKEVKGMRIDTSASDPRLFFPPHCRLSTLGYAALEARSLKVEVGAKVRGRDEMARPRSGRAGIASWKGESAWAAECQFAPGSRAEEGRRGLFCKLEVGGLAPLPVKRPRG